MAGKVRWGERVHVLVQLAVQFWFDVSKNRVVGCVEFKTGRTRCTVANCRQGTSRCWIQCLGPTRSRRSFRRLGVRQLWLPCLRLPREQTHTLPIRQFSLAKNRHGMFCFPSAVFGVAFVLEADLALGDLSRLCEGGLAVLVPAGASPCENLHLFGDDCRVGSFPAPFL